MPSLLEALEQKYGERGAVDPASTEEPAGISVAIFVPCRSPRVLVPALLVLNDCNIATAGEKEALVAKCSNVEELDLANNKLNHWEEVFSILQQMPRLKFVNLSFNILSKPLESNLDKETKWERLRSLVLNSTYINWDSVHEILDHVPCLEELHLSLNDYNDVKLHTKCDCTKNKQSCIKNKLNSIENTRDCTENNAEKSCTGNDIITNDNQNNCTGNQSCTNNFNGIDNPKTCTGTSNSSEVEKCAETENANNCDKTEEVLVDKNDNCQCDIGHKFRHKHGTVKILHFTGNPVENWLKVKKLGYAFPNLETLVLAECPIKSLELKPISEDEPKNNTYTPKQSTESSNNKNNQNSKESPENDLENEDETTAGSDAENNETPHDAFHSLKILNLNSTMISSWDDIEKLSKFPNLQSIRLQGCPLWESNEYTEHERRQLLIARLPNVQTLNGGGIISAEEREDAERAFIRYYMDKPESDQPDRYFELVQIHGRLDPLVNVDLRPEKRVKVTFTCGTNSEVRSVDVYRTVNDLKSKLEGFAGFSAARMRFFYVDKDLRDHQGPEEMKFPHKQLYSYNIQSGDEIIIDCKRRTVSETKMSLEEEKKMYNL